MQNTLDTFIPATAVCDGLPFAAFTVDTQLNVQGWNKAMEELTSIASAQCLGRNVCSVLGKIVDVSSEALDAIFAEITDRNATQEKRCKNPVSFRLIPPGGAGGPHDVFIHVVRDAAGKIHCLLGHVQGGDAENCEGSEFYRRLLSLTSGMAYKILNDGKWTILYVSEGCKNLTGHDREHFIGNTFSAWSSLIHPEDEAEALETFHTSIAKDRPFEHEFRIVDAHGNAKWVVNTGRARYSQGQELASVEGYMRDRSSHKEKEQRLEKESKLLRTALRDRNRFGGILGESPVMHKVFDLVINAAMYENSVFIHGETGTGKELVARAIHDNSPRGTGPFIAVNCGAIPEPLIESEFFGYKKGAFTGAGRDKPGVIESAAGGTLFLDEIGEISLGMQIKLLRALESSGFSPVGGNEVIRPDVRIITASNRDLPALVDSGQMRRDFFYRIYVIPIVLPPLRERGNDVVLLANHFIDSYNQQPDVRRLSKAECELLKSYSWPGNVRELQNAIRRYLMMGDLDFIREVVGNNAMDDKPGFDIEDFAGNFNLSEVVESVEKKVITAALSKVKWHKIQAASLLGISRRTLFRKIKELGLE